MRTCLICLLKEKELLSRLDRVKPEASLVSSSSDIALKWSS